MSAVETILRPLGINRSMRSFKLVAYAIELALENEDRLQAVTKDIYYVTAEHFGCKWKTVEKSIHRAAERAWLCNPKLLTAMAGYPLNGPPTASEFIEFVFNTVQRKYILEI